MEHAVVFGTFNSQQPEQAQVFHQHLFHLPPDDIIDSGRVINKCIQAKVFTKACKEAGKVNFGVFPGEKIPPQEGQRPLRAAAISACQSYHSVQS